jgi:hypothetical protein
MYLQRSKQLVQTRATMATIIAHTSNRGTYFACKIVTWEISWLKHGFIEEGRQGCFTKTCSWFNDEGVMLNVQERISGVGEHNVSYSKFSPYFG